MSGKITGILTAVTVLVCAGYTAGTEPPTIDRLTILDDTLSVCFTRNDNDLTDYNHFAIVIQNENAGVFMKPYTLTTPTDTLNALQICTICAAPNCLTDIDKTSFTTHPIMKLTLHIEKDGLPADSIQVQGATTMPDDFTKFSLSSDIYVIGDTGDKLIKVSQKIENLLFLNDADLALDGWPCGSSSCYYNGGNIVNNDPLQLSFMICKQAAKSDVPVCGDPKNGIGITDNDDDDNNNVPFTVDCGKTPPPHDVSFTLSGSSFTEVIDKGALALCKDNTCPITANILLVDYTDSSEKFKVATPEDRTIEAFEFTPGFGTIEVIWSKNEKTTFFKMSRISTATEGDDDDEYHIANIDCSAVVGENCYGYFVDVVIGKHDITIQEITEWNEAAEPGPDSWTYTVTTEKKPGPLGVMNEESRMIHVEPIGTIVTESSIKLDVCFKIIQNTFAVNTHYEFLAVNDKGKWKKQIYEKKINNSDGCFHELELPFVDFSQNSNFFVLLRDSTNGKPLASEEIKLDLPALRAIKPEVDNGSNGSTSTLAIVGAAIGGIACLMALVAVAVMFVMKINRDNDGLQYPLRRTNIEDSNVIHGLDNPIPTM